MKCHALIPIHIITGALIALIATGCGKPPAPPATAPAQVTPAPTKPPAISTEEKNARLDAALAAVRKERRVKDASWLNRDTGSILAGVVTKGGAEYGYAEYLCQVMLEHKVYGGIVRVMDVVAATRDKWVELARVDCPTQKQAEAPVEWVEFDKHGNMKPLTK